MPVDGSVEHCRRMKRVGGQGVDQQPPFVLLPDSADAGLVAPAGAQQAEKDSCWGRGGEKSRCSAATFPEQELFNRTPPRLTGKPASLLNLPWASPPEESDFIF